MPDAGAAQGGQATKTFALDPAILGPNSSAALELSGSSDADVLLAVAQNQPFPARAGGSIDLGHIGLSASGGNQVSLQAGQVTVAVNFAAGVTAGAAVYDDPQDAIQALGLPETPGLDLSISADANARYALLRSGYQASGKVSGTHPIGMLGSFSFGASGAANGVSAVLHRFSKDAGADTVLRDTVKSWKLPTHIRAAAALQPATWVIAEADGSLAVNLAANLGYNFSFVRQAQAFGLSGDIGLKLDAAASASFGFDVSGKYVVVVGRESADPASQKLRLRLFKLSSHGMQFGLNLKFGVTGVETLTPNSVDDFVKAVFGVHGAQVVSALDQIDKWTNKDQSVGQLVAGLTNERGLALLQSLTGINAETTFDAARAKLLDEIQKYQQLPDQVSSELLGYLNKLDAPATKSFQQALTLLSSDDAGVQKQALLDLLNTQGLADSAIGKLLNSMAGDGLLTLVDRLPQVRKVAGTTLSILNGGVIAKLQDFINQKLDLTKVMAVAQQTDFAALDSFLVGRLSAFFDRTLKFSDLAEVKNAIQMVMSKRQDIYDKARTALNSRYGLEVAATWQRTSSSTAVLDVEFDLADASALALYCDVVGRSNSGLDRVFTTPLPSVHLNAAVLSHELTRKATLDLSLPHFDFQSQNVTQALASVKAEDDQGRMLLYDASGSNVVSVRNKFRSSASMTIAAVVSQIGMDKFPDLRVHSTDGTTWSYQLRYVKPSIRRNELEAITEPFLMEYMPDRFTHGTTLSAWYDLLEQTSEGVLGNGPQVLGDTCLSLEVSVPGDALGAWALPVPDPGTAARNLSLAIQQSLKKYVLWFYVNDISKLADLDPSAAMLTWASIPDAIAFDGTTFSSPAKGDVIWDFENVTLRKAAAQHAQTAASLLTRLPEIRSRLEDAGLHSTVQFYEDNQVGKILGTAITSNNGFLLERLLLFESEILRKAGNALKDIQSFVKQAATSPTKAVDRLADFAADITTAFNDLTGNNVFVHLQSFRSISQMVFAEASRALSPTLASQPEAMLTLNILQAAPPRQFQLGTYLDGTLPASADITVAQRLVKA